MIGTGVAAVGAGGAGVGAGVGGVRDGVPDTVEEQAPAKLMVRTQQSVVLVMVMCWHAGLG